MRCVKQSAWRRSGRSEQNRLRQRRKKSRRKSCRNTDVCCEGKNFDGNYVGCEVVDLSRTYSGRFHSLECIYDLKCFSQIHSVQCG